MSRISADRRIKNVYQPVLTRIATGWSSLLPGTTRIGVTGSVGKTSTKDFIHLVLGTRHFGAASFSTTNNDYSAARTLFRARPWHRYCVQEIGASGPGSLDPILRAFRPEFGVLTCIGKDHYSRFRGEDAVAKEKSKLVAALPEKGVAFLNGDDPRVLAMKDRSRGRVVVYGRERESDIRASNVYSHYPGTLSFDVNGPDGDHARVVTGLYGEQMLYPALAALAVGKEFGVSFAAGAKALSEAVPEYGRMRHYTTPSGITFIDDSYKASLWSMPAAFRFLADSKARRKWLVLGSISDHPVSPRDLGKKLLRLADGAADRTVLIGRYAHYMQPSENVRAFETVAEADRYLHEELREGDLVFVKGTHACDHLSRLVLSHLRNVSCWRDACDRDPSCFTCPHLG